MVNLGLIAVKGYFLMVYFRPKNIRYYMNWARLRVLAKA